MNLNTKRKWKKTGKMRLYKVVRIDYDYHEYNDDGHIILKPTLRGSIQSCTYKIGKQTSSRLSATITDNERDENRIHKGFHFFFYKRDAQKLIDYMNTQYSPNTYRILSIDVNRKDIVGFGLNNYSGNVPPNRVVIDDLPVVVVHRFSISKKQYMDTLK